MRDYKLHIEEKDNWLTIETLTTLKEILENQDTTNREEPGEYVLTDDNDIQYFYEIDEDYDVIVKEIRY